MNDSIRKHFFINIKMWTIFLLSIPLLLYSCGLPYCKKVLFSKRDLAWMVPYSIGDTIVFRSIETSDIDTLIVTNKIVNNPSNSNPFCLEGCNWMEGDNEYKANAEYQFKAIHHGEIYDCLFILEKKSKKECAEISLAFWGKYTINDVPIKNAQKKVSAYPNNEWILLVTDKNLYSGKNQLVRPLSKIYWSRDFGLIGYKISSLNFQIQKVISN